MNDVNAATPGVRNRSLSDCVTNGEVVDGRNDAFSRNWQNITSNTIVISPAPKNTRATVPLPPSASRRIPYMQTSNQNSAKIEIEPRIAATLQEFWCNTNQCAISAADPFKLGTPGVYQAIQPRP